MFELLFSNLIYINQINIICVLNFILFYYKTLKTTLSVLSSCKAHYPPTRYRVSNTHITKSYFSALTHTNLQNTDTMKSIRQTCQVLIVVQSVSWQLPQLPKPSQQKQLTSTLTASVPVIILCLAILLLDATQCGTCGHLRGLLRSKLP